MITFSVVTIMPEIFDSYLKMSIIGRAVKKKLVKLNFVNPRRFTKDRHKTVDDRSYGGGAGMVLKPEPLLKAVDYLKNKSKNSKQKIVLLSAKGKQFNQKMAYHWAKSYKNIIFISGRYEGIDERVRIALKAEEISIGPYILTDGDVAVMAIISAVTRLIPGAIKLESLYEESHWNVRLKKDERGKLEYPHYTRPETLVYQGRKYRVPKVLLSGDHQKIEKWRKEHQKTV
ncbi:MAG TPA: tRNA (guanosine(37)-N1)-methyltransferase TrmD [Candidatus Paceibacterota bacterium]|nr:tRNA (guanosine(37)-N1)-methyltransferase TrmD [Candidatus Paceibacterota bacterium]